MQCFAGFRDLWRSFAENLVAPVPSSGREGASIATLSWPHRDRTKGPQIAVEPPARQSPQGVHRRQTAPPDEAEGRFGLLGHR